ncbi:MAG: hypothetical protein BLM47_06245 [Candidatus Reconcilbacillus cellulovorans]|uniref:DUF3243 domain-containing protein n=1 Tax=Candidatus Reconcilbacillus cellulovorans TaxID=1906605 RepID=A0A2A6E195_9BACL|nr:MAG: hypothetical protein BLM47_06245 [Candidatus Reconcilbacillus cellulovorans]
MPTILKDFEKWKTFLESRVEQAKKAGMSDEAIAQLAYQIGNFLAEKVDPENREERLLKELWDVATEDERKTLARVIIKFVERS